MKSHYYHAIQSALKYYISCTYETRRGILCSILSAQSSLSIFAQKYLCKCEDTYFILQNKYLCIHKDNFGGKILRDDCAHNTKKHLLKILQQVTKSAFERSCSCEAANKVHLLCSVKRER